MEMNPSMLNDIVLDIVCMLVSFFVNNLKLKIQVMKIIYLLVMSLL